MQHIIVLISTSLLLFQVKSTLPPPPPTAAAVDEILFKGFPFGQKTSRAEIEKILGKPTSVSEDTTKKVSTLRFAGLTVELAEVADQSATVSSIELTQNRPQFPAKIHIGSTREEVTQLLGKADIDRPPEWIYGCYDCVYDHKIHFIFDGNKVKQINWDFYLETAH